jgi:hypothetical protein
MSLDSLMCGQRRLSVCTLVHSILVACFFFASFTFTDITGRYDVYEHMAL